MVPLNYYMACSVILFFIGLYCLIVKRNMVRLLMALEIMMNAVNLNFIALSSYRVEGSVHPLAHVFTILSIGIGGCIIALGLVITLYAYRHYRTLDVRELRRLKG
ncbi:MAG: NADH-quinone oxidoreductase subunit NuoK [Candidatus Bathyarchaeota archaeon]|nr:NADH-quinone oxidoreductase subunit NuoK [Candidatus Bathyarchaeota archaeon]MDH5713020.1 NADH-quinone oxidoreductase subunit NuoK [Candidatus Bathyarchaeota archaeon]